MIRFLIIWISTILSLFLQHCASPKPLTGGPKDEEGPMVVRTFPDSGSLQMKDSKMIIKFNEFINPQSYSQDVWISPEPPIKPEIRVNGKKIKVFFKNKLLPEQTYTVVLTKAIVDFHERNPMKNQVFIPFSTGGEIDQAAVSGKIFSAYTGLPMQKITVAFIPKDSVSNQDFTQQKPFYFAKSDENGQFNAQFLKPGFYYSFVFDDKDQNGIFTKGSNEAIALNKDLIQIKAQKKDTLIFKSFIEDFDAPKVKKISFKKENQVEMEFSDKIDIDSLKLNVDWVQENKMIRAFVPLGTQNLVIKSLCDSLNNCRDTIIDLSNLSPSTKSDSFFVQLKTESKPDTAILISSSPFKNVNDLTVQDTSGNVLPVNLISNGLLNYICFPAKWDTTKQYVLHIPKSTEMLGKAPDSLIKLPIKPKTARNFGSISGTCESNYSDLTYVWTHLESNEQIITKEFKLNLAKTGTYKIWVFSDIDKNGKWSSGQVNPYQEPEPLFRYFQDIKVKGGFDVVDVKISWKNQDKID